MSIIRELTKGDEGCYNKRSKLCKENKMVVCVYYINHEYKAEMPAIWVRR